MYRTITSVFLLKQTKPSSLKKNLTKDTSTYSKDNNEKESDTIDKELFLTLAFDIHDIATLLSIFRI